MNERERIISEVLKLLPELVKGLSAGTAGHPGRGAVSLAQVKALIHLALYGPQTMGELAQGLGITTASATSLMNPLVEAGYVLRARDSTDRRVVRVALSPQAEKLAQEILAERRRQVEEALQGLDDDACRTFLLALGRLAKACRGSGQRPATPAGEAGS